MKIPNSKSWLQWNDTGVLTSSYLISISGNHMIFYPISLACIPLLVFKCDDPTCNPSLSELCFARGLYEISQIIIISFDVSSTNKASSNANKAMLFQCRYDGRGVNLTSLSYFKKN